MILKYLLFIFLVFTILLDLTCCSLKKNKNTTLNELNIDLKNKLEEILIKDQGIRLLLDGDISNDKKNELFIKLKINDDSLNGNKKFELMERIDNKNISEIDSIISIYGYPTKKSVGMPANKAAFLVIQHSSKIEQYLPLIRQATKNGDISKVALAMMEDRNLMYHNREQLYGTQIKGKTNKNGEWIYFLWPLKNADSVNVWRKEMGFDQTIQEYLKDMKVENKFYTIESLKDL